MSRHEGEFERFEHAGRTVVLCYDPDCPSPRDNDGCLCVMACWHRRENLGDRQINPDTCPFDASDKAEFVADLESGGDKVLAIVPIWIYQHSGIALKAQVERPGYPFTCQWDSGQVGWAYVMESRAKELECVGSYQHDGETITWDKARYEADMAQEVELYDRWSRGEFAGYIVEDEDGDKLESCWGFDDVDYCRAEAKSVAESARGPGQVDGGCNSTCEGEVQ